MSGYESKSSRWDKGDPARMVSDRVAAVLVEHMTQHGYSERELCAAAGISKTTWHSVTNRPFPSHVREGMSSLLSLRDFIAAAQEMKLDPIAVLAEAMNEKQRHI